KAPKLEKIEGLSNEGKNAILNIWETAAPFRCMETAITERGYKTLSGYQVRNILMFLSDMSEDEVYKEIAINFDKSGAIGDIYFTLDMHDYKAIMESEGNDVTDMYRRQAIINFLENFRTAYYRKDIELLAKVYSDDSQIITGKVVKQTKNTEEKNEYQTHTKKEYISKLRSVFKNNAKINVVFDNIEVVRHPKYNDIYGVNVKISWNTKNYSEAGYLFLLIDFKDDENMAIHVRTWQPEKLNGRQLQEDEILRLSDFEFMKNR
ncbi:MAG: nuclear transport factor 2 family protein, partial [Prevotellaceae bacterium]|nr:nuclear transport factor 2 family protein [Prevotellaceae bacterium]